MFDALRNRVYVCAMNGDLLEKIEQYLQRTGLSGDRFGFLACHNSRLVRRLRAGGRVWPETEQKVRDYLAAQQELAE